MVNRNTDEYDPKTPAALLVVQDGQLYNQRDNDQNRLLDVLDNLIYAGSPHHAHVERTWS